MFTTDKEIRFHHCDPAGIVFYPQYFFLLSEAMEDFMAAAGKPQHEQINLLRRGWPIIKLDVDFVRMSRYGDKISIDVIVKHIGGASLALDYVVRGDDGERLRASTTVVHVDLETDKPITIPDDVRAAFTAFRDPA
jgi:4-hydroxybenzoyl-CoA thioesterase